MNRLKIFIKTSLLGGLAVILPAALLFLIFKWFFNWVTDIIQPLTNLVLARGQFQEFVADAIVFGIILTFCFGVGAAVKTKIGRYIQENLENHILKIAPGYPTIKSIVMQFIGKKKSPFSSVALVRPFENDTLMTAFITDSHDDDMAHGFCAYRAESNHRVYFSSQRSIYSACECSGRRDDPLRHQLRCGIDPSYPEPCRNENRIDALLLNGVFLVLTERIGNKGQSG